LYIESLYINYKFYSKILQLGVYYKYYTKKNNNMQYIYGIKSSFSVTLLLDLPLLSNILEACNLKPNYSSPIVKSS